MKIRISILMVLAFILSIAVASIADKVASRIEADSVVNREYRVKAAFLYNFARFVDWPGEKAADTDGPIIIGIIGNDPFGGAFESVKDAHVKGRKVAVERFKSFDELKKDDSLAQSLLHSQVNALRKCHLLFICSSSSTSPTRLPSGLPPAGAGID